jgi:hypothetical protein
VIEILVSSEIKSNNIKIEQRKVDGEPTGSPWLMIGGYSATEVLTRADQVIQAAEKIKRHAEEQLKK